MTRPEPGAFSSETKVPPYKLAWFEAVTDWISELGAKELPEGVSRPGLVSIAALVLRSTKTATSEALVAARWIERMAGVNRGAAVRGLAFLEECGWLVWTGRTLNRVKLYTLSIQVVTDRHHSRSSGDASGDDGGDASSHTPGTPGTPTRAQGVVIHTHHRGDRLENRLYELALEEAKSKGAHSPEGLARKILTEDRERLIQEIERRDWWATVEAARKGCQLCDSTGWIEADDGAMHRCRHGLAEVAS